MKATIFVVTALAAALCLAAASCGKPQSGAAAAARKADGPVGVWEMRYQDAVGQSYLDVLELRPDGSYATYMRGATPDDHGAYALADGALTFTSQVDPRLSQSLPYEVQGDRLKIYTAPFPGANPSAAEWQRSDALPAFQTRVIGGDELPVGLPGMAAAAMASHALPWRADAQPVSLEVEISPPGRGVNVRLRFFSPAANEGLQLNITKYTVSSRTLDGSRMERRPLPADFADLADILDKAASDGLTGKFRRADIRTYENAGPAWMISPEGPRGATYSAITRERIHGDVTGYIAQYEADWAKAGALWRQAIEQRRDSGGDLEEAFKKADEEYKRSICELDGGDWRLGACY